MERSKIVKLGDNVQIKKKRKNQKCDICNEWVSGNNISNHQKLHKPPTLKCEECDYLAHFQSQVDYHYNRKHVHKIKQGRPKGIGIKRGNSKPRVFSKKILSTLTNPNPSESTQSSEKHFEIRSVSTLKCVKWFDENDKQILPKQIKRQRIISGQKTKAEHGKQIANPPYDNINKFQIKANASTKESKLDENLWNFCITFHPATFLFKDPVCKLCLGSGNVMKCSGKCCDYFHKECLSKSFSKLDYSAILKRKMTETLVTNNKIASVIVKNSDGLQCTICTTSTVCFVCSSSDGDCIQCCETNCGKSYHLECLKYWPQHKIEYANNKIKSFICSRHICHTCVSPNISSLFHRPESENKLIKCMLCPGTYHRSSECIPAGSELLSETQLICARHQTNKHLNRFHMDHCMLCSEMYSLICCDNCPHAIHQECLKTPVDDQFNCAECESGRRPLYGEIVWCKYSNRSPWWPSIIVPTPCIPEQVIAGKKEPNQICVFFFGTHNYGWVSQSQIYRYVKEDNFQTKIEKKNLQEAINEAEQWMDRYQEKYKMKLNFDNN